MFRFTIRDMLWLTVLVGMGVGWWVNHRSQIVAADAFHSLEFLLEVRGHQVKVTDRTVTLSGGTEGLWTLDLGLWTELHRLWRLQARVSFASRNT
jgi:hypothetical protein